MTINASSGVAHLAPLTLPASPALPPSSLPSGALASASVPQPRLVRAAHEFEAAMMKELMAPLASGHDGLGDDDDAGSSSALTSFAGDALGKAISEHGGFGIAKSIIQQLGTRGNHSGKTAVPTVSNRDTLKSPLK